MIHPKQTVNKKPKQVLKYLPIIGILIGIGIVLFLLFGRGIINTYKKNRLKQYNVILITLDTLRADFVSAYPNAKASTPHIDQVAAEGVRFDTCISQTPLTLPSHTTILSGTYPLFHQVRDNGGFLVPDNLELIGETLKKHGYTTSAFIASYVLHSEWGINQGFDFYFDDFDLTKYEHFSLGSVQKRAEEVLPLAKNWLKENKNRKFFSWIHLYDPHTPYDPPSPFKEKYPKRPYRGEVEYLDDQLGQFFDFLREEDIYNNSIIIMAGDHGEGLGQHNEMTHGFFIYESTVRVPLIIRAPIRFPNETVKDIVELVDISPTILEALDIPIPTSYQGQSLLDLMFKGTWSKPPAAYTETYFPRYHFGWSELKAIYTDNRWKYILAPEDELYDMETDPKEETNLVLKKSYQSRRTKERIERFIRDKSINARTPGNLKQLDKEDMQKLAALGYITTFVDTSGKSQLPDPKGKVTVFNDLTTAKELMADNKLDDSIDLLKKLLADDPKLVDGILQLGNVYFRKKMFDEALKYYYEVLNQKPDYNAAMVNVVSSLAELKQYDRALNEIQRFMKVFPRDHTFFNETGDIYILKGDLDKALEAFTKSIDIEKTNPNALNKAAGINILKKNYRTARQLLEKALEINPNLKKLHFHMAQVEEAEGFPDKAMYHYKEELKYNTSDFKSSYNLAEQLRNQGKIDEAVKYYQQTIDNNPQFNIPYFMIAKYYLDRRINLEKAAELCKQGIDIKPPDKYTVFGYYILADIFSLKQDKPAYNSYLAKGENLKRELMRSDKWDK